MSFRESASQSCGFITTSVSIDKEISHVHSHQNHTCFPEPTEDATEISAAAVLGPLAAAAAWEAALGLTKDRRGTHKKVGPQKGSPGRPSSS